MTLPGEGQTGKRAPTALQSLLRQADRPLLRPRPQPFLVGGDEMGSLIRSFDWSKTPIGPVEQWSPSLRMMVSFLLANRFPLLLWWGPRYISIYNDAYRPVLGTKHPWALGRPVSEVWSEIWSVLKPLIDTPFEGGPATWMDDIELHINRHGFLEEVAFHNRLQPGARRYRRARDRRRLGNCSRDHRKGHRRTTHRYPARSWLPRFAGEDRRGRVRGRRSGTFQSRQGCSIRIAVFDRSQRQRGATRRSGGSCAGGSREVHCRCRWAHRSHRGLWPMCCNVRRSSSSTISRVVSMASRPGRGVIRRSRPC